MKKSILLMVLTALVALCFAFASCDSGSSDPTPPPVPTPTTVAVESISLDKNTLLLKTGTYGTLTATVLPENATNKSVTWSSDKPEVATVDQNGKVTGEAEGTATITVTTTDGAKTAFCEVTVADEVYTVSFNMKEHGTQLDNQTVAKNGKIDKPTDPEAEGFNFKYWYKDEETVEWDFDTEVTADMTLNAKWVAVYRVSFAAGDGSGAMDPSEPLEAGTSYTIPANGFTAPTIDGLPDGVASNKKFFTGWKNGSADITTPTIEVNGNIELTAQWAKPSFTVGKGNDNTAGTDDDEKVYFSKGNLQAVFSAAGSTKTWRFAENQYDFVGDNAANTKINDNGSVSAAGIVDLFGWSTASTDYGISPSTASSPSYFGDFKDWGTAIDNAGTWKTLTDAKWDYLLNTRIVNGGTGNGKSYSLNITYGDKMGLVLYPDDYTGDVVSGTVTELPDGCVFLPAAGNRNGSSVYPVGLYGYYWSATAIGSDYAYYLYFNSSDALMSGYGRCLGQSVRLVCGE